MSLQHLQCLVVAFQCWTAPCLITRTTLLCALFLSLSSLPLIMDPWFVHQLRFRVIPSTYYSLLTFWFVHRLRFCMFFVCFVRYPTPLALFPLGQSRGMWPGISRQQNPFSPSGTLVNTGRCLDLTPPVNQRYLLAGYACVFPTDYLWTSLLLHPLASDSQTMADCLHFIPKPLYKVVLT